MLQGFPLYGSSYFVVVWSTAPIFILSLYNSWEYYVQDAPRIVLDKLEKCGYRVVSMTGVGQTLVWCLHKESLERSCILPF